MMVRSIKYPKLIMLLLAIGVLLAAFGNAGKATQSTDTESLKTNKGTSAPLFDLQDLNGNKVALADYAGQRVYVKFWASWCSICLAGLDELNTLANQENDFKVITIVSPDFRGEQSIAGFTKWFKKQEADNITVLLDQDGTWTQKFGVRGYPTSAFIGSDGVLVNSAPGHKSNEIITQTFKAIK